ncbi:MAG: ABC transporter permease [Prosthecobacter sp.]|uniref:ABC transporter permease n=1 Tax=Prosthecobacter sp. TaxID=1965333 RepID=UPI0025E04216|nr:ABC transporter permease [Prosthecobacter sp.]MCF7786604.1 ABC transporter permease [Prosthecobacter sp.]
MNATTVNPSTAVAAVPAPKREPLRMLAIAALLEKLGLGYFSPFVRMIARYDVKSQWQQVVTNTVLPGVVIILFMGFWTLCSHSVHTDSQRIPTPTETWKAWQGMREFARNEAVKKQEFLASMSTIAAKWDAKAAEAKAAGNADAATKFSDKAASYRSKYYAGPPTFGTQIMTSLLTVAIGIGAATLIAVPLGFLCGLSPRFNLAMNPIIQIFKPVSPLAWLPIVFVFVTALYHPAGDDSISRALLISAGTVTLCSLWPTLINTAVGVAGVDRDYLNVAKVLKLNAFQRIWKIILPAALPLIFTGMRLSIGVGWMVLIAADMLAQNPGLGKFVWDTFQNGSTESMAQIIVAVFAIGFIGFVLDRIMLALQRLVTFGGQTL